MRYTQKTLAVGGSILVYSLTVLHTNKKNFYFSQIQSSLTGDQMYSYHSPWYGECLWTTLFIW